MQSKHYHVFLAVRAGYLLALTIQSGAAAAQEWPPIGRIVAPKLRESSGIVKSALHEGVFWVHNDSGNEPTLFAIRSTGELVATMSIVGAANVDWEDIARMPDGSLIVGDIGDNYTRRNVLTLYQIAEPQSLEPAVRTATPKRIVRFSLPEGPVDCEALIVYEGVPHVIAKHGPQPPKIYRVPLDAEAPAVAELAGSVPFAPITAADVSADGKKLVLLSYGMLAVYDLSRGLDALQNQEAKRVSFPLGVQTEGVCFDGDDVIITAESRQIWRVTSAEIDRGLLTVPEGSE